MSSRGRPRQRQPASASRNAGRQQPASRRTAPAPPAWPRLITEQYVPPAPRDLPELRGQLAAWLDGQAPKFYLTMALVGRQWVPPAAGLAASAAQVARQERLRVTGDLYWVSAPMTDLARHAAPRLPTRNLYAHDLPSRTGFMVFETPLAAYVNSEGREVQIAAVSWGPWDGPASQWEHGGIWLTFYSHPAPLFPRQAFTGGTANPAVLAPLIGTVPPMLPDNEAGWPFGELSDGGQLPDGTTAAWALTVRAGWRLMRQHLAHETAQPVARAARRRLARAGLPDSGVRVIHIRRRDHVPALPTGTPATRQYHVQWWVGGHWRTYWCGPGRRRPEDRWIDPYLAGPDGKPVHGAERVNVWDR